MYFKLLPFILGIWLLIATFFGIYRRIGFHQGRLRHLFDLIQSSAFFVLSLIAFTYFYEEYRYSNKAHTHLIQLGSTFKFNFFSRILSSKLCTLYQIKKPKRPAILIAAGDSLRSFINESKNQLGFKTVGVVLPKDSKEDRLFCIENNLNILSEKTTRSSSSPSILANLP